MGKIFYSTKFYIILGVVLFVLLSFCFPKLAHACSGIYVGNECSEEGTSIIARSNDLHPVNEPCYIKVYGGPDGAKLKVIKSDNGFEYELPDNIYRFITIPNCDIVDNNAFLTSAINEKGVSISATLTGYCCKEAIAANPYVKGGIVEDMFPAVIGATCENARQGIELIAKIIDEKGSGEDNIIMISDQNECWYMEIYGGHEYCAIKAPDDCVCAMGNEFMIDTVDENSPNTICSKNLFNLPKSAGFAVMDSNGKMNIHDTYSGKGNFTPYSHMRTWEGHRILSPSTIGDYSASTKYPLFFKPDNKVSLKTVMDFFRDRYEGTPYDLNNSNNQNRPIATESQVRTHILQTYKDVPADMACVEWLAFSNAEFSTYTPISNKQKVFDDSFTCNIDNYDNNHNNAYSWFKSLNSLAAQNRKKFSKAIRDLWKPYEEYHRETFTRMLHEAATNNSKAQQMIDDYCSGAEKQAVYEASRVSENVIFYMNSTEETFKKKFKNIHKGDLTYVDQEYPEIKTCFDIELFANIHHWDIEKYCYQDHNPELPPYDYDRTGAPDQADNGGKEIYLKMNKNGHTVEIHSDNGHLQSQAKFILDGEVYQGLGYVEDGRLFVSNEFYDYISEMTGPTEPKYINPALTTPSRSLDNQKSIWETINSWPIWIQVIAVVASIFIIAFLTYFIVYIIMRKKSNNK